MLNYGLKHPTNLLPLSTKNRGLDLPLHALLRGRGAVHRYGPHPAGTGAMCHEPGVEFTGLARGETEQQVELTLGESLRSIDALIGDDEMRVFGGGSRERSLHG